MELIETNRLKDVEELKNFVESTDNELNELLSNLGWSENSIRNVPTPLVCPFDKSHHLCEKTLEQHLEKCQWQAEGYGELDVPLSIPSLPADSPSSVKFDEQLQEHILQLGKLNCPSMQMGPSGRLIPRTSERITADFTVEERKLFYEYAVANTVQRDIGEDIADLNKPRKSEENKPSSYLELLAQERNLKRRRAKHRGVHTNKKSHVEIFRDVINQQMEMLAEYIAEKNEYSTIKKEDNSSHSHEEYKRKDDQNHERKKLHETHRQSYMEHRNHSHRSHRSTNEDYYEHDKKDVSRNHRHEVKHSKLKKKSKEHNRHRDRSRESRKRDKTHRRHRSKHRHREKNYRRERSYERDLSKQSKKSKNDDKKKDKYRD